MQENQLVPVPRTPTVTDILQEFKEYVLSLSKTKYSIL
jgi:hypothetical protein